MARTDDVEELDGRRFKFGSSRELSAQPLPLLEQVMAGPFTGKNSTPYGAGTVHGIAYDLAEQFGIPAEKDHEGSGAWDDEGAVQLATRAIKDAQASFAAVLDFTTADLNNTASDVVTVIGLEHRSTAVTFPCTISAPSRASTPSASTMTTAPAIAATSLTKSKLSFL